MSHSHLGLIYLKIFHDKHLKEKQSQNYFLFMQLIVWSVVCIWFSFRYEMTGGNINRILRGLASRLTTQFQRDEVSNRLSKLI